METEQTENTKCCVLLVLKLFQLTNVLGVCHCVGVTVHAYAYMCHADLACLASCDLNCL